MNYLPLPETDIQEYQNGWRERFALQEERLRQRKLDLYRKAKVCAQVLKENYHVTQVILFGSLTGDKSIHERTDIDLAVVGLPSKDYFHALALLYEIPPNDANVDLITLEDAPETLNQRIKNTGEPLL